MDNDADLTLAHPALSQQQFEVVLGHPVLSMHGSDYQPSVANAQQQDAV